MRFTSTTAPFIAATNLLAATPALAHHPLGGMPMTTFAHGALSGVGHPLLGFDHLFFVLAMGVAAAFVSGGAARLTAPLAYVGAMALGVGVCVLGVGLPLVEPMIAVSLLAVGAAVMRGRALTAPVALGLFAAAGLFHGWAFGGALAEQEGGAGAGVLVGYLLGLGLTQYLLAVGAGFAVTALLKATDPAAAPARLGGAMVAGVGAFLTLEALEGPLLGLLGLA